MSDIIEEFLAEFLAQDNALTSYFEDIEIY